LLFIYSDTYLEAEQPSRIVGVFFNRILHSLPRDKKHLISFYLALGHQLKEIGDSKKKRLTIKMGKDLFEKYKVSPPKQPFNSTISMRNLSKLEKKLKASIPIISSPEGQLLTMGTSFEYDKVLPILYNGTNFGSSVEGGVTQKEYISCSGCRRLLTRYKTNLNRHERFNCPINRPSTSEATPDQPFKPRFYRTKPTICEKLENFGFFNFSQAQKDLFTIDDYCVFDCESALLPVRQRDEWSNTATSSSQHLKYISEHQAISVGFYSEIPSDPREQLQIFIQDPNDPSRFLTDFIQGLLDLAEKQKTKMVERLQFVFDRLDKFEIRFIEQEKHSLMRKIGRLRDELDKHCSSLVCLSYNGRRYGN